MKRILYGLTIFGGLVLLLGIWPSMSLEIATQAAIAAG